MNRKFKISIILLALMLALTSCSYFTINEEDEINTEELNVEIGALKGATAIGLADLIQEDKTIATEKGDYNMGFRVLTQPHDLAAALTKGEVEMAAIPGNLASTLYNRTEGEIITLAINTLGVHYILTDDESVKTIEDLEGKTIYSIGKGATPEVVLKDILEKNNINANIEFVNEAPEIGAVFKTKENTIAMVPEPFASVILKTNEDVNRAIDVNEIWREVNENNPIVTGVFVARKDFVKENEEFVLKFLEEYKNSIETGKTDPEKIANIVEENEIVPEGLAKEVIPFIDMEFIEGSELELLFERYLTILFNYNPEIIGGELPNGDFYYKKQ